MRRCLTPNSNRLLPSCRGSAKRLIVRRFGYDSPRGQRDCYYPLAKDALILINNRQQSGRRRGRGGQRQNNNNGGGGRGPDTGNRIDSRARGNAAQLLEKYKTLARDAQQSGDRVLTEYYLQFADHYFRVLSETRARYEENTQQRNRPQGDFAEGEQGFEGEDGDEGVEEEDDFGFRLPVRPQQQQAPQQQARDPQRPREDRPYRDERPRDERPQRDERPRDERPREERPRADRQPREDRPREDRPRRDYGDDRGHRAERATAPEPRRQLHASMNGNGMVPDATDHAEEARLDIGVLPPAISASAPEPVAAEAEADAAPAPRKRGRPRKVTSETPAE